MIERVAQGVRHRAGPGEVLVPGVGIAGDDFLRLAIGAHGSPFVMVSLQPNLAEIGELPVFGNLSGRQVIVIVENGLAGRVLVV